ncbi:hypothetical protein ACQKKX_04745 [Neorhizobium sp. NPDC001467]|uniref:hypothetical protein n=1 Tax=Neorhizobium sp. NPDC001467 TaxID=3390595 RepID=UPI003D045A7C
METACARLFGEVGVEILMDIVVEGSVTFDDLAKAISFWDVEEDCENARWVREMATVPFPRRR